MDESACHPGLAEQEEAAIVLSVKNKTSRPA